MELLFAIWAVCYLINAAEPPPPAGRFVNLLGAVLIVVLVFVLPMLHKY